MRKEERTSVLSVNAPSEASALAGKALFFGWYLLRATAVRASGSAALSGRRLLGRFGAVAVFTIRLFHCITSYDYVVQVARRYPRKHLFPFLSKSLSPRIREAIHAHNKDMKRRRNTEDGTPVDKMIQANKDEADSTLALWGLKARPHPKKTRDKTR